MSDQTNPEHQSPRLIKPEEDPTPKDSEPQYHNSNSETKAQPHLQNQVPPNVFFQPSQMYPGQQLSSSNSVPPQNYRPPYYPNQQYPYQGPPPTYRPPFYPQQTPGQYPPQYYPHQPHFDYPKRHSIETEQAQPSAQQLFRTHNPSQVQQIVIPNSEICGVCEKPGASIKCISICKKFYHKECAEKMGMKTIHQSESNGSYFIQCENCLLRMQRCQICQKQGFCGKQMIKCHVNSCNYFFHKKCIDKEKELKSGSVQQTSPIFICGAHQCQVCNLPFRIDELLLRCIKCVVSFHEQCKEGQKITQLTSKQFICQGHVQEQTPQVPKKSEPIQQQVQDEEKETEDNKEKQENKLSQEEEGKKEEEEAEPEQKDQEMKEEIPKELTEEEKQEEAKRQLYKRMRTGLASSIDTGELIQVQRQVEHASFSTNMFRSGITTSGAMIGPPSTNQSYAQWKKVDPSETLVINSNTLQKVNDILQIETKKKLEQDNLTFKQVDNKWKEEFLKEAQGKSVKRVGKIIKKMQGIEEIEKKEKRLLEAKFEEYRRFIYGEYDERVRMND